MRSQGEPLGEADVDHSVALVVFKPFEGLVFGRVFNVVALIANTWSDGMIEKSAWKGREDSGETHLNCRERRQYRRPENQKFARWRLR